LQTIDQVDVNGKTVIVRVDFNVPLSEATVTDDTRIRAALPTINYLLDNQAKIILISHLGRPAGSGFEQKYSLEPVRRVLSRILGKEVKLAGKPAAAETIAATQNLQSGDVLLLENLRFDAREKQNSAEFAAELANLGDIYVDDAFGAAHRAHASVEAIAHLLPTYCGLLLINELATLGSMLAAPNRPFLAILGGSKVSDKIKVIESLLNTVDTLLIGGAMCFTFLAAKGLGTGKSLREEDWIKPAAGLLKAAEAKGVKLLLPVDVVLAAQVSENAIPRIAQVNEIPEELMGLDIGPASCELYAREIAKAKTVFWNGPMGVFELKPFENGTKQIAKAVAANRQATSIIGGGDSVSAVKQFGLDDKISFISTGGGASMQLIEGKPLPGVEALDWSK
jgi:phosphoglycerate kinase